MSGEISGAFLLGLAAAGLAVSVVGWLGFAGKLLRGPSQWYFCNYTAMLLCGLGMLFMAGTVALGEGSVAAMVAAVPTAIFLFLGVFCGLFFVPQALKPAWQRQLEARGR